MERRQNGHAMPQTHMIAREAGTTENDWFRFYTGGPTIDQADGGGGEVADGTYELIVDLSHALSQRLGRQMSMMSVYRVNYIRIELLNNLDLNDNDDGLTVGGKLEFWAPSKHRVDAMQMARAVEKHVETGSIDGDSFLLTTQKDYTGMRFNWDADDQVVYATTEAFSELTGNEWDLLELFNTYDNHMGVGEQTNRMWTSGRTGYPEQMQWACSFNNLGTSSGGTIPTGSQAFEWNGGQNHISVLGGLLHLQVQSTSTDSPFTTVDDDYKIAITIGVEGWRDF